MWNPEGFPGEEPVDEAHLIDDENPKRDAH